MGATLDFLTGVYADVTAYFENLGWEGTLILLLFVGLSALAVLWISKLADSAEHRPRTFTSLTVLFIARVVRAFIIFGVVCTVSAGVSGPRVPMILLLVLLAIATAIAIREAAKRRGRGVTGLRS
jgi:hypothetical protein